MVSPDDVFFSVVFAIHDLDENVFEATSVDVDVGERVHA